MKIEADAKRKVVDRRLARRGISLLEVLITIFVLTAGLLGIAALVPVGFVLNSHATRADRSAACGRAAMREIETRDMLNYKNWFTAAGDPWRPFPHDRRRINPFVIDPLFIAENGDIANSRVFPYNADVDPTLQLTRITLAGLYDPSELALSKALAEQVSMCRDDIIFEPPTGDSEGRPVFVAAFQGDYSWMAMVTPAESENPAPSDPPYQVSTRLDQRRMFTVTVVVFYKRVTVSTGVDTPSERQVQVDIVGRTTILSDVSGTGLLEGLAPNQWIMISGMLKPAADDPKPRPLHRWYRIASVGQAANKNQLTLKLAGPDWPPDTAAVATIVDKVVGVFERTIELDLRSLTSP